MAKTKQQQIDELQEEITSLRWRIGNMYSVDEYKKMKDTLISDHKHTEMCLQATQIQLATYKGMVDVFERFTDTQEPEINNWDITQRDMNYTSYKGCDSFLDIN